MKKDTIDFVITWVDGEDPKWIQSKNEYLNELMVDSKLDSRSNRYRDMDVLKYWFRGVEKNAPWVNKVYFVTCGQKPDWLNENYEKLVLVNHSDYIPKEYLPTFNSNAIEIYMHRIKGLSNKFVYFNDDMFLMNKVSPCDFFKNDIPCDSMAFHPIEPLYNDKKFYITLCNNIEIINKYFDFKNYIKKNISKVFSIKQGSHLPITLALACLSSFRGFYTYHSPIPYLKDTFEEVWKNESEVLTSTLSSRFRDNENNINHWLFQFWQFASGNFYQRRSSFGKYIEISDECIDKELLFGKSKTLCINDSDEECDFEKAKNRLKELFEKKYPQKSKFEK